MDNARSSGDIKNPKSEHLKSNRNLFPKFEDYIVENVTAKIDSQTINNIYNPNKHFFDAFYYNRNGLDEYCKIFAGKYIAIDISQGSETVRTYIFDSQTGVMYESPLFMYSAEYRGNSRLYIKDPILDEIQQEECKSDIFDCDIKYFVWNEDKKQFEEIK